MKVRTLKDLAAAINAMDNGLDPEYQAKLEKQQKLEEQAEAIQAQLRSL